MCLMPLNTFVCVCVFHVHSPWRIYLSGTDGMSGNILTQLAHDAVTTLVFRCLLVATSDNVKTTLSQRCLSVAPTKLYRCYNVVFSTSIFWPDTNVVATSCFWRHFSDKNLTVYQRHYDSLFPKLCKWSFNSSFW